MTRGTKQIQRDSQLFKPDTVLKEGDEFNISRILLEKRGFLPSEIRNGKSKILKPH